MACGRNETIDREIDYAECDDDIEPQDIGKQANSSSYQTPLEEIAERIEYEYVYENMIDHIADYDYKQLSFLPTG